MTEAELDLTLQAAARAGDPKAKAFLRMWYSDRAARKASNDSELVEAPSASAGSYGDAVSRHASD